MPLIIYETFDGQRHEVELAEGVTLMAGALNSNVLGIDAECGGCLSCATCHVYVDIDLPIPAPSEDESEMLQSVAAELRPNSRLSCQIVVTSEMAGAIIRLPRTQS